MALRIRAASNYAHFDIVTPSVSWLLGNFGATDFSIYDGSTNVGVLTIQKGNTANRLTIDANGLVGISSTTPTSMLDIKVATGINPLNIASSSGTSLLTLTPAGFVGIGTTSPNSMLSVASTTFIGGSLTAGATFSVVGAATLNGTLAVTGASTLTGLVTAPAGLTTTLSSTAGVQVSGLTETITNNSSALIGNVTAGLFTAIRSTGSSTAPNTASTTALQAIGRFSSAVGTNPATFGLFGAVENTGAGTTTVGYSVWGARPLASAGRFLKAWAGGFDGSVWIADNLSIGTTTSNALFSVASSTSLNNYMSFNPNGTSTLTIMGSTTVGSIGSQIIMKDSAGTGCTKITTNAGVMSAAVVTCP